MTHIKYAFANWVSDLWQVGCQDTCGERGRLAQFPYLSMMCTDSKRDVM